MMTQNLWSGDFRSTLPCDTTHNVQRTIHVGVREKRDFLKEGWGYLRIGRKTNKTRKKGYLEGQEGEALHKLQLLRVGHHLPKPSTTILNRDDAPGTAPTRPRGHTCSDSSSSSQLSPSPHTWNTPFRRMPAGKARGHHTQYKMTLRGCTGAGQAGVLLSWVPAPTANNAVRSALGMRVGWGRGVIELGANTHCGAP